MLPALLLVAGALREAAEQAATQRQRGPGQEDVLLGPVVPSPCSGRGGGGPRLARGGHGRFCDPEGGAPAFRGGGLTDDMALLAVGR
ncbi:hypothetical protein M2164_004562 [Streptomyces sp. SAI-208]|nr:hypothetical protein [Streptomyces sp. SAI-208]